MQTTNDMRSDEKHVVSTKRKLIIEIFGNINDQTALMLIDDVVKAGKISTSKYGDQYCFATVYEKSDIVVDCEQKHEDLIKFRIYKNIR